MARTPAPSRFPDLRRHLAILAILMVLGLAAYVRVTGFEFLQFDDNEIVCGNEHVTAGLTWPGIVWAWTHPHFGIWMPLTSMSHMLDAQVFGDWAGGHHLTNLLLHLANVAVLYFALSALTGSPWRSMWVAALFAVHPFGAGVAGWVSSRKELTWALCFFLALWAYARYARKPAPGHYVLVLVSMALGVLCKPMIMTLPCVLLLLDWWPLGRWRGDTIGQLWARALALILEKAPMFLLSVAAAAAAVWGQRDVHAVTLYGDDSLGVNAANAAVSYARYLFHAVWPVWLSGHYPHLGEALTPLLAAGAALLLLAITAAVLALFRRAPCLLVGWFWFLGTLLPVIGLVQYANASMADRYAYVPVIGLFIMAGWGVPHLQFRQPPEAALPGRHGARRKDRKTRPAQDSRGMLTGGLAVVSILALAPLGWWQAGYWHDTERLFARALEVTKDNALAHTNLGMVRLTQQRCEDAVAHYREAARIEPRNFLWQYNLGSALLVCDRPAQAVLALQQAVRGNPEHAPSLSNLGTALLDLGRPREALRYLKDAVRLDPAHVNARINYARALSRTGNPAAAAAELEEALRLDPASTAARQELNVLRGAGQRQE